MRCRACDGPLERAFEMAPMPLAGSFTATRQEALDAPRYPLAWSWCAYCGLVNVEPDIPDEVLFRAYRYAASEVPAVVRHHRDFAAHLRRRHQGRQRVLDIGCNDGVLINRLPPTWTSVGVDPSDIDSGDIERIREPFTSSLARGLGKFDIVTASNSFAHFTGIGDAIAGIADVLTPDGTAYIEVHDLDVTLATGQWDTIYHEHKVEWSQESLALAFGLHGLRMISRWRLPLHGGLIRAAFRKCHPASGPLPRRPDFTKLQSAYAARRAPDLPGGSVGYGAAGRASVYLNQVDTDLRYIVDGSPRRAGRYVPGVGLRIATPAEFEADNPPAALITAWNHAPDIKARHPGYDRWLTTW